MGKGITGFIGIAGLVITLVAAGYVARGPLTGGTLPPRVHLIGAAAWIVVGLVTFLWGTRKFTASTERPEPERGRLRMYKR
ncbi:DUF4175 domain-containing protein [Halostella salina]|uniref:DUF4175 domain-containing protein n=1 Tax=Halostella salina TaxID=1547897 RepID=UPI0013CE434D|nr:DUF4175 domain-containing protein [Halostella salina]